MSKLDFPICGLEEAAYNKLKAKHGNLYLVTVKGNGKEFKSLHRDPGVQELDAFLSESTKAPASAYVLLFNATNVAKDPEFNEATQNGEMLCVKAGTQLNKVLDSYTADLKNL